MTHRLSPIYIVLATLLAITSPLRADVERKAPDLATTLKKVFANWTKAMGEGDTDLWQKSTAQYRQNGIRNIIVSQKKKWPEALFEAQVSPPDISSMTLARVMENGSTAQLVYFGKADFGIESDEIPDGLVFLMFVKQRDGWKFNTLRFMSLVGAEEIVDQASAGLYDFLDAPHFKPPGRVPPLPKLCAVPDRVGYVEIISIGYETELKVADRSSHTVIDNVQKGLIIGGLKTGINQVTVRVKPLALEPGAPKDTQRHFEFSVYRQTDDPDEPLRQIYTSGKVENPKSYSVIVRGDS